MILAANSGQGQRFRNYQFQLANTLLHEVGGHLLVTYIGTGRPYTPPAINHPLYSSPGRGEAGRSLERKLWGGALEFYRSPAEDDTQVSQRIYRPICRHLTAPA